MVGTTNIGQFRSFIDEATPDDLATVTPLLFNRIATLDSTKRDQVIQQIKSDPQAKVVFEKMKASTF